MMEFGRDGRLVNVLARFTILFGMVIVKFLLGFGLVIFNMFVFFRSWPSHLSAMPAL